MALKDWKKTFDKEIIGNDRFIHYQAKKSDNDIIIEQRVSNIFPFNKNRWEVLIRENLKGRGTQRFIADNTFMSKKDAFDFAKCYRIGNSK